MKLSIIVPVLNEAAQMSSVLEALRAWRGPTMEVIVVDGGSTDQTIALADGADRIVSASRGRAVQMNAGAAVARGELLMFLHADCRLPGRAPDLVIDAMAGRAWGRFDVAIDGRSPALRLVATMMNLRSRWTGIATGDQAIFVRRTVFDDVGGFPAQALMEDIELSRRLRRIDRPVCLADRVVTSGRRWERDGVWRTIALMWALRLRYWLGASPDDLAKAYR